MSDNRRFRPRLEFLDDRIVPGFGSLNLGWTDGTGDGLFQTAANWRNLATGATSIRPPAAGDRLTFDGSLTNDSLTNLHGFNLDETTADYLSISINNYSGTVTIAPDSTAGLATSNFTLASGAISQPVTGTDLTVLTNFTWTGGTLNSSTNLANVTISGSSATATIAPTSGGTVNLGSNITVADGANAEMGVGTINVTNSDLTFAVSTSGSFNINPGTGLSAVISAVNSSLSSPHVQVGSGAAWTLVSGDWTFKGDVRNEGTFTLGGETLATLEGTNNPNDPDRAYSYLQSAGATYLSGSSTLLTGEGKGVKITAGILATKYAATERSGNDCSALIAADNLLVTGGDIYIGYGFSHLFFGTLSVSGDVLWIGGTYHPCVRSYANGPLGESDKWEAGGRFEFGNNSTPTITPIVVDAEGAEVDRGDSGVYYVIIKADTASFPPPEGAPSYDTELWDLIKISPPDDNTKVVQYNLMSK